MLIVKRAFPVATLSPREVEGRQENFHQTFQWILRLYSRSTLSSLSPHSFPTFPHSPCSLPTLCPLSSHSLPTISPLFPLFFANIYPIFLHCFHSLADLGQDCGISLLWQLTSQRCEGNAGDQVIERAGTPATRSGCQGGG